MAGRSLLMRLLVCIFLSFVHYVFAHHLLFLLACLPSQPRASLVIGPHRVLPSVAGLSAFCCPPAHPGHLISTVWNRRCFERRRDVCFGQGARSLSGFSATLSRLVVTLVAVVYGTIMCSHGQSSCSVSSASSMVHQTSTCSAVLKGHPMPTSPTSVGMRSGVSSGARDLLDSTLQSWTMPLPPTCNSRQRCSTTLMRCKSHPLRSYTAHLLPGSSSCNAASLLPMRELSLLSMQVAECAFPAMIGSQQTAFCQSSIRLNLLAPFRLYCVRRRIHSSKQPSSMQLS